MKTLKIVSIFLIIAMIILLLIPLIFPIPSDAIEVLEELESPNGEYTATIMKISGGMTVADSYQLSVHRTGTWLNRYTIGNVYNSKEPFKVKWLSDDTFYVSHGEVFASTQLKHATKVYDITIVYGEQ